MFARWASVVLRDLIFVAVIFIVLAGGGAPVSRKTPTQMAHTQAKSGVGYTTDKRVEAVARAICVARGVDPDHVGPPFPAGPIWEFFIPDAVLFLAEYDAASEEK